MKWAEENDVKLLPSNVSGIKKISLIRLSKIATIDKSLAVGKLGQLQKLEIIEMNVKLKRLLQLD